LASWPGTIALARAAGVMTLALTPEPAADDLAAVGEELAAASRWLLLAGNEGFGLQDETMAACDRRVRIPMASGVDSINVATAVAIALYELGRRGSRARSEPC
jgi:tRNA G18 (ribose-2'-O)-methylase SpoU